MLLKIATVGRGAGIWLEAYKRIIFLSILLCVRIENIVMDWAECCHPQRELVTETGQQEERAAEDWSGRHQRGLGLAQLLRGHTAQSAWAESRLCFRLPRSVDVLPGRGTQCLQSLGFCICTEIKIGFPAPDSALAVICLCRVNRGSLSGSVLVNLYLTNKDWKQINQRWGLWKAAND